MISRTLVLGIAAASLALSAVPALADNDSSSSSSSSTSVSSSSSSSSDDSLRVERCKRFSRGDDYERCVRLIRRLPARNTSSNASSAAGDWKWTNIENRIDKKMEGAVKFVSTMAKQFCREETEDTGSTTRDCMARVRDGLKIRVATMIDTAFRADLPSAR